MRKIFILLLIICFINTSAFAVNFDTSIDANIRKDYNVETAEENLPKLPSVVPTATEEIKEPPINIKATGKVYTLKGGTKITLVSRRNLSDRMPKGSTVTFSCKNGFLTKEEAIIPEGTIFKGRITDSHPPQLTGNGGLIELMIDEIYFNGVMSKIDTKISLANSKRVFFSDIKGKRKYWKNFANATKPGRRVFSATQSAANAMSAIPIINLLSFVPLLGGAVIYTVNVVSAPVIAIFTKGGSIALPAGTEFEIKIKGNTIIKG